MSERIHALAQHLLGKSSIEECSLEEIQHLTKRYPFFAPAQFLLLQKLKDIDSPDAVAQQRKAVLYYPDPLQFDYFLSPGAYAVDDNLFKEETSTEEKVPDSLTAEPETGKIDENIVIDEEIRNQLEVYDSVSSDAEAVSQPVAATVFPDPDIVTEEPVDAVAEPPVLPVEPLEVSTLQVAEKEEKADTTASVQPVTASTEDTVAGSAQTEELSPQKVEQNSKVQEAKPPASTSEILFEPYHTVDYFASQGIKVTAEDLSAKDKLSKQMRSFTEWLKVMKRLPATEMAQTPRTSAEKTVENMATHSVEGSEVVTEAMAEVWAKQGAREKAIETYNKLSLLNPSKKAYFAAKIENLKGS